MTFYGVWIGINSISVSWHRNPVNIREGIAIGFISVMESREICFFVCGILMDLVLAGESKLLSFFVQWSNLTSFCVGPKIDGFYVCIEIEVVSVCAPITTCF